MLAGPTDPHGPSAAGFDRHGMLTRMDRSTTETDMPEEAQARTFEQAMELWVYPEIERRRGLGLVEGVFELASAQVIMREGEPIEVRLNEEVTAVARMKPSTDVRAGEAVNFADVQSVREILLTDADADAAHLTVINLGGGWTLAFDFRYNATKARRVTEMAAEFLSSAAAALRAGYMRAAADASPSCCCSPLRRDAKTGDSATATSPWS